MHKLNDRTVVIRNVIIYKDKTLTLFFLIQLKPWRPRSRKKRRDFEKLELAKT